MKIYANQLSNKLKQGLSPCYLIFGDEPYQVDDCRRQIKAAAKLAGVEEFIRLSDDEQFDWNEVSHHCQAMSLFSSSKVIELEVTGGKILKAGADVLKAVADDLSDQTILVLFGPKLDSNQTKAAWFKTLEQLGLYVPIYDIDGNHLTRWLNEQLQQRDLRMSHDAQLYLLEFTAGNLLACAQELEKLSMALPQNTNIDLIQIKRFVSDQSRYSVFQLMDQLWLGNTSQCMTILDRLKTEELEPNIILWAMQKDVLLLQQLSHCQMYQLDTAAVFTRHKVWKNKQQQFLALTNKIPSPYIDKAISLLAQIDTAIKQQQVNCPYSLFAHVCLLLTGHHQMMDLALPLVKEM